MKILITGATGFIGSSLCSRLLSEKKHEIIILSRYPENVKSVFKSIGNIDQLENSVAIDVVIAYVVVIAIAVAVPCACLCEC